jgi:subtilisin-like proprotein convertase family protein
VAISVAADRDWITLNGLAAPGPGVPPELSLTLAAAGEPGERATIVVGIVGFAIALPLGVLAAGAVAFDNVSASCDDRGSTTRGVSFLPGQGEFTSGLDIGAIPDGDPSGVTSKISLPEAFCVADIDLTVRTLGGNANDLTVELVSPAGSTVRLWAHHGLDATDIRRLFDDASAPAPTGELLATFNGESGSGSWELRLVDDTPGGENSFSFWSMTARSYGTPPCGSAAGEIAAAPGAR